MAKGTKRRAKYALPDIETRPSGPSRIRTKAEDDAEFAAYKSGEAARIARAQGRHARNEAAVEKERRRRVAARTPPPPPRSKDATPKDGGAGGGRTARPSGSGSRRRRSKLPGLPKQLPKVHGNARSILVGELVASSLVVTAGRLGRGEAPELGDYVPLWLVYLFLAFAVTLSKGVERIAVALGALLLVALVLRDVAPITHVIGAASTGGHARKRHQGGVPFAGPGSGVRNTGPHGGVGGPPRSNRR